MVWQWDTVVSDKSTVCQSCPSVGKKGSGIAQHSIFGAAKHWPWTPRSGPLPSCVEKLMVKQSPTLIHLRHAKTFLSESLVRGCTVY